MTDTPQHTLSKPKHAWFLADKTIAALALLIAAFCLLPHISVILASLMGDTETLRHLADSVLGKYIQNTGALVVIVGVGTFLVGTGSAWLVTMTDFPGRRWLEVALVIPLAFPAYVLAYAYTHILTTRASCKPRFATSAAGARASIGSLKSAPLAAQRLC